VAQTAQATRRTPLYFGGRIGWLHEPADASKAYGMGAVLCAPFGQEEICAHYGVMMLAETLAAAGIPSVRFDYLGTGNSADFEFSLATFNTDVEQAAALLRQHCGPCPIALIGARLGATVATLAAENIKGVQAFVLMAPVLSGAMYMRETRAAAAVSRLASRDPVPPLESGLVLNTNGFHWTGALQQEVAATDITKIAAPQVPVLMLPSAQDRRAGKVAAEWKTAGTAVTEIPFDDYADWMQDPTTSTVPQKSFTAVAEWLSALPPASPATSIEPDNVSKQLVQGNYIEEPIQFGAEGNLFGILCRPVSGGAESVAALLLHEGSSHTIGNGRAYVALARRLASEGVTSFRIDLSSTGDSPTGTNTRHPHYDLERMPEISMALDVLEARGFHKATAFGLCSGAYTAFQAALIDERIVACVLTNLQKFKWHYGDDIRVAYRSSKRTIKGYLRALKRRGEWKRILSGDVDFTGIVRVLSRRGISRVKQAVQNMLPPAPDSEVAFVRAQMNVLSSRKVHTYLIYSDDDPGLADLWMHFGRRARRLQNFAPASVDLVDYADHHFNGTSARKRYYDLATNFMLAIVAKHTATPARDSMKESTMAYHG